MRWKLTGSQNKTYYLAHFRDICAVLSPLTDELENTKEALPKDLMRAQDNIDFPKAREILDAQEELSQRISDLHGLLKDYVDEDASEDDGDADDDTSASEYSGERVDYTLYDMDDTVAYDIEVTPVTFKRPAAFSFKGTRYPVTKWKTMLVRLCSILYKEEPQVIRAIIREAHETDRNKFKMSTDKSTIRRLEIITGSDIWIETNRSAADIRKSMLIILEYYRLSYDMVKVYFRRDYAALHADDDRPEKE